MNAQLLTRVKLTQKFYFFIRKPHYCVLSYYVTFFFNSNVSVLLRMYNSGFSLSKTLIIILIIKGLHACSFHLKTPGHLQITLNINDIKAEVFRKKIMFYYFILSALKHQTQNKLNVRASVIIHIGCVGGQEQNENLPNKTEIK